MSHRHYALPTPLIATEKSLVVYRDFSGLSWVRETRLSPPVSSNSIFWGEVVGITIDIDGRPVRTLYLKHDREADGQGYFSTDEYGGVPARADRIAVNEHSWPPDYSFRCSPEVVEREAAIHQAMFAQWSKDFPIEKQSLFGKVKAWMSSKRQ